MMIGIFEITMVIFVPKIFLKYPDINDEKTPPNAIIPAIQPNISLVIQIWKSGFSTMYLATGADHDSIIPNMNAPILAEIFFLYQKLLLCVIKYLQLQLKSLLNIFSSLFLQDWIYFWPVILTNKKRMNLLSLCLLLMKKLIT